QVRLLFVGQRLQIGDHVADGTAVEYSVAPEGQHLADASLRVAGVNAYAQGLGNRLGVTAPQPAAAGQAREAPAALSRLAMAHGAVVTKESAAAVANDRHQAVVALD